MDRMENAQALMAPRVCKRCGKTKPAGEEIMTKFADFFEYKVTFADGDLQVVNDGIKLDFLVANHFGQISKIEVLRKTPSIREDAGTPQEPHHE